MNRPGSDISSPYDLTFRTTPVENDGIGMPHGKPGAVQESANRLRVPLTQFTIPKPITRITGIHGNGLHDQDVPSTSHVLDQGIDILAFSAAIRALGLSNRDLQPKKLSNFIRSGYLQIQLICSLILFQFKGNEGVSRDQLYDSVCEVFPMTTYSNFRKILRIGVDNEIFIRSRSREDSRRTLYGLSDDMLEPLCTYFLSILVDFGDLYSRVISEGVSDSGMLKLLSRITDNAKIKKK